MTSNDLVEIINEQTLLIESEIDKTTEAAKKRCRSAANKIKNAATEFKKTHK